MPAVKVNVINNTGPFVQAFISGNQKFVKDVGDEIVKDVDKIFDEQGPGWPALSEATMVVKGVGGRILEQTGDLRKSYKAQLITKTEGRVISTDPKSMIHEFGAEIVVTEKMRSYLHIHGIHLSPETDRIFIPERPVLRSAVDRIYPKLPKLLREKVWDTVRRVLV